MHTKEKFAEAVIYAMVNLCTSLGITAVDTVDILNAVLLGHTNHKPLDQSLDLADISKQIDEHTKLVTCYPLKKFS